MSEDGKDVVTFLLTDVEGSSRQWDAYENHMSVAVALHDRLINECVARHQGKVLQNHGEGDSFFAVFELASQAVAAAADIQRELPHQPWPPDVRIRVRIALHTGEAGGDGDYRGRHANRCARVRGYANGGQVLLTGATAELVLDALPHGASLIELGEHDLRGFSRPERILQLALPGSGTRLGLTPSPKRHDLQTLDFRRDELEEKVAIVEANLEEFRRLPIYRTLSGDGGQPGRPLRGITHARVRPALDAFNELSTGVSALKGLLRRATALRSTRRPPGRERLAELDRLLFGPSIELPAKPVPIARRRLLEDRRSDPPMTPDELLRTMEDTFEVGRGVVLEVDDAWNRLVPRLEEAERNLRATRDQRPAAFDPVRSDAAQALERIIMWRELAREDPLGMAESFDLDRVAMLEPSRRLPAAPQGQRESLDSELRRARSLLTELRAIHDRLPERPPPAYIDGDPMGLAPWLARIEGLQVSGFRPAAEESLVKWQQIAKGALASEYVALAARATASVETDATS